MALYSFCFYKQDCLVIVLRPNTLRSYYCQCQNNVNVESNLKKNSSELSLSNKSKQENFAKFLKKLKHFKRKKLKEYLFSKNRSAKYAMRWSESATLEFVKIYLKQECLWNPTHGGYKLKYKREQSYATIIAEFMELTGKIMTVSEVKNKIKNLRTTYSQEVHKILHKSRPNHIYEPSLVWFQEMDRCLKHVSYKRQSVNYLNYESLELPEVDSSSHSIWADSQDQDMHNSSFEDLNPDPLVAEAFTDTEYDTGLPDEALSIVKIEPQHHKRNKKKKLKHKPIQTSIIDSQSENLSQDDEFDIYGKFIATQLRQMDLNKALRIQLAIQNLLSEARLSDYVHT